MGGEFWGKELTAHLGIPVEMSWARAVAARAETATAYFMMEAGAGRLEDSGSMRMVMTAGFCRGGGESSVGSNVGLRVSGSCGKERGINGSSNLPGTGRGVVSGTHSEMRGRVEWPMM